MFSFLNNVPTVTKNLLILNVLFFLVTILFADKIDLIPFLGAHYVNSTLFQPYQVITHFFMHGSLMHIFFNMFAMVTFGSLLERLWGPKRFFIFYISSAIGAFLLYNVIGFYEIMEMKKVLMNLDGGKTLYEVNDFIHSLSNLKSEEAIAQINAIENPFIRSYVGQSYVPMVGASGAVFGIMAGFAYLFPNTELTLMFIPFPIKAKYLVGGYFAIELYLSFKNYSGDSVAHLAHVGGAVVGFALVYFWNRNKKTFY